MRRAALVGRAALLIGVAATPLPAQATGSPMRPRTTYEDLQLFGQVLNQIRVNHPDSIEAHELFLAAVEAMVHAADPHSYVVPAVRLDAAKAEAYEKGKLYPVPIDFSFVGGTADSTAKAFSPFTFKLSRPDGSQQLKAIDLKPRSGRPPI